MNNSYFPKQYEGMEFIDCTRIKDDGVYRLKILIHANFYVWNYPFSLKKYHKKLVKEYKKHTGEFDVEDYIISGDWSEGQVIVRSRPLGEEEIEIDDFIALFKRVNNAVLSDLLGGFFIKEFDFPQEIRTYCEQYLIYFAQFLKDIGVKATASITENDGKSIFRVKPTDKGEALEKIKKALEVYLNLPAVVTLDQFSDINDGVEIQRLYSNIQHLQSQLGLALATIRQQNMLMQGKDQIIDQQNRLIVQNIESGRILMESIQNTDGDSEVIIDGVASIKKYEIGPFELDLPSVFRKVKELFDRSDEG